MTHVSRIGSRDYTLQGRPYVDERVFTLKMRVIEHTKSPMAVTIKKKPRQRRARHLFNKQNYTVLKYAPLRVRLTQGVRNEGTQCGRTIVGVDVSATRD